MDAVQCSLAMEGRSEDAALTAKVREAVARARALPLLPKVPLPPGAVKGPHNSNKRTMQIELPDNASHIIICTNNNGVAGRVEVNRGKAAAAAAAKKARTVEARRPTPEDKDPVESDPNKGVLGGEGHICTDCGKRYSTSSNLARHKQTHR